jgi:presenilin-like A22 family membrane protease
MSKRFKAAPRQITPVLVALMLAGFLTYGLKASEAEVEPITIFPETPSGVSLNTLLFVVMMAVAATVIYLLLRYQRKRVVKYLLAAAMLFVTFFLLNWYGELNRAQLAPYVDVYGYGWIGATAVAAFVLLLGLHSVRGSIRLISVTLVGSLTGTFLGVSVPMLTAVVLLAALALYDFVSVYRGPIGKLAQMTDLEELKGAVFTVGDLTIGMGDLVFYSMVVSTAMMNFGMIAYVGAFLGVSSGSFLSFKMLERREMFPGLPFAVGLGLAAMLVSGQLQGLLHL